MVHACAILSTIGADGVRELENALLGVFLAGLENGDEEIIERGEIGDGQDDDRQDQPAPPGPVRAPFLFDQPVDELPVGDIDGHDP